MAEHHLPIRGTTSSGGTVTIDEIALGILTQLAGWECFEAAATDALKSLALPFPSDYRVSVRQGTTRIWRTAPDRVLVRSEAGLGVASSDDLVTLDLSDARFGLSLRGPGAPGLLSRIMALDFAEAAFPVGAFAQGSLHHVGVLVDRYGIDEFQLLIPTTWASSLTSLIADHLGDSAHDDIGEEMANVI